MLSARHFPVGLALAIQVALASHVAADASGLASIDGATIAKLEPWSRTQVALSGPQGPAKGYIPRSLVDFQTALKHQRPHAVERAGGVAAYAPTMSLNEASFFKGFTYEESLVRRWNGKPTGPSFRGAIRGHEFIDIEQFDPLTGKVFRTYQAYGGADPRAAMKKLLLSDAEAEKLVLPRDVFDRIRTGVTEIEGLWNRVQNGELNQQTGTRLIRNRAAKIGLSYDESNGELFAADKQQGRGTLGRLGTPEISEHVKKLVRDKLTSEKILSNQVSTQISYDAELRGLWERLGGNHDATLAIWKLYQDRISSRTQAPIGSPELIARKLLADSDTAVQRATVNGVSEVEINSVLAEVQQSIKQGVSPAEAISRANESLEQMAENSRRLQVLKAQGILMAFALVGAGLDYAMSDQELSEWLSSTRATEWGSRGVVGIAAMPLAATAERVVLETAARRGGEQALEQVSVRLGSRVVGGGVAAAVFVIGDSIIAAVYRSADWGEIRNNAFESVLVIALSEGTVIGAELVIYGEIGAMGGPLGFAIAVGVGALYEGLKYLWTSSQEQETDKLIFVAKCDVARAKIVTWCNKTCARMQTDRTP